MTVFAFLILSLPTVLRTQLDVAHVLGIRRNEDAMDAAGMKAGFFPVTAILVGDNGFPLLCIRNQRCWGCRDSGGGVRRGGGRRNLCILSMQQLKMVDVATCGTSDFEEPAETLPTNVLFASAATECNHLFFGFVADDAGDEAAVFASHLSGGGGGKGVALRASNKESVTILAQAVSTACGES